MANPVSSVGEAFFKKSLEETGPVRTFARLCTSHHLEDLQWIAFFVAVTWLVGIAWLLTEWQLSFSESTRIAGFSAISFAGLTGAAATAITWAYQTGCNRIGVVDLFGCEISAICRVCLVVDFARVSLDLPDALARPAPAASDAADDPRASCKPSQTPLKFTSEEHYTPVYDNNLSDLQPLDASVVTSVTEFYTYRKTMMDFLRKLGADGFSIGRRRETATQMIYMQFLMYESGRCAVQELIEFEPNRAESLINIYCSEIILYRYLMHEYGQDRYQKENGADDFRLARLRLRESHYLEAIPKLLQNTLAPKVDGVIWERAKATAQELLERFFQVFPDSPSVLGRTAPIGTPASATYRGDDGVESALST